MGRKVAIIGIGALLDTARLRSRFTEAQRSAENFRIEVGKQRENGT